MKNLEIGDVFILKNNMVVGAEIPKKYVYDKCNEDALTRHHIKIGEVYKQHEIKNELKNDILHLINEYNLSCSEYEVDLFIENSIVLPSTQESIVFESGEYVVIDAKMDGGSGINSRDYYPDGWHIFAKQLSNNKYDNKKPTVDFYQTGCFVTQIDGLKSIRKLIKQTDFI